MVDTGKCTWKQCPVSSYSREQTHIQFLSRYKFFRLFTQWYKYQEQIMNAYREKDKHANLEVWVRSTPINTVTLTLA